jgi:outer membrane protein assembly factor BamD (BamD/ComL family)
MMKVALALSSGALAAALGTAPMQCGHGSSDAVAHEDSPGDALYALSQDFHAKGNDEAAKQTLRYLVEKYPSNRHVPAARAELEGTPDTRTDAGK